MSNAWRRDKLLPMQEQTQRRVLVTGGTGVLGSSIVRSLCRANDGTAFDVVAGYRRNAERAHELQRETGCTIKRADVGVEADVEALFAQQSFYAVIHAAGISHDGLLARYSRANWDDTLRTNADGTFLVVRAALQSLEDSGRLILLASRVGERGAAGQTAYAASKAAVLGLMRVAAREGAERGICVNAICPGFVPSAMTGALTQARLAARHAESLQGDYGSAEAVAGTIHWLLSAAAADVSGQILHCDNRI